MKYILFLLIIISCNVENETLPTCPHEYEFDATESEVRLKIISNSDFIQICREDGRCSKNIVRHYFNCISTEAIRGETLVIVDNGSRCEMVIK